MASPPDGPRLTEMRVGARDRCKWLDQVLVDVALGALPPSVLAVAVKISHHINGASGETWPGQRELARGTGLTERRVSALVIALEKIGHLHVMRAPGRTNTNRYRMQVKPPTANNASDSRAKKVEAPFHPSEADTGRQFPGSRSQKRKFGGEKPEVRRRKSGNQLPTELVEEQRRELSGEFDAFWAVYPHKVAKQAARGIYDRIINKRQVTPEQLLAGARKYADERRGQDAKYTKHPTTWLNGGCWEDEGSGGAAGNATTAAHGAVRDDGKHFDGVRWVKPMGPA